LYANFTFCFSFWGTSLRPQTPLPGLCPWALLGTSISQDPWPGRPPIEHPPLKNPWNAYGRLNSYETYESFRSYSV